MGNENANPMFKGILDCISGNLPASTHSPENDKLLEIADKASRDNVILMKLVQRIKTALDIDGISKRDISKMILDAMEELANPPKTPEKGEN